jgi:methylated-DNA-[protein]-cysteine S-methyltransferase
VRGVVERTVMTETGWVTTVSTPDGPFTVIVADGAVIASGWSVEWPDLLMDAHPSLRPTEVVPVDALAAEADPVLATAVAAVSAYYAGDPSLLPAVPVRQKSGPYREHVWAVLHDVQPGEQVTYAELAARAGRPTAVRAAASACSHNAVPLFVPCHRVVRTGGLGGFGYGVALKVDLLTRETPGYGSH